MRFGRVVGVVLCCLVHGVLSAAPCTTTLPAGGDIQAAIAAAAAGDVICLSPGNYSPAATLVVNKSITLQGPQTGVDPRPVAGTTRTPGNAATEAIIDGGGALSKILSITASGVVLDGLEIRNATGDMIESPSGAGISGIAVRYNIIRDALGDEGMQLRDCAGCVVEYNHVYDIAQDGINVCCGSTGGAIRFNEVHDNSSENAAIYVYQATSTTIECNLVYDVFFNEGIKLGTKGGADAAFAGGNILHNTTRNTAQDGIAVYMSDVRVSGNDVSASTSANGAIYLAYGIARVDVSGNNVHDNTLNPVKWGDPAGIMIGTAVDATTVTVNGNNITGNTVNGVSNKAAATLDAEDNWWGAADGPSGAGPGSGDAVSANVDFDPWLAAPVTIPDPCAPPPPTGACCTDGPGTNSDCVISTQGDCDAAGGLFLGGGSLCENVLSCEALVVSFDSMSATAVADGVWIRWTTAAEIDTVGFRVMRESPGGRSKALEPVGAVVPATGFALAGASYELFDSSPEARRATAYYVADIDIFGRMTLHGPIAVERGTRQAAPPDAVHRSAKQPSQR